MLYSNSQGIQEETQLCDTGTKVAEMKTILPFFDSLSVTWNHWFLMANTFVQCHINSGVKTNKVLVSTFSYKRELRILILQYSLCRGYIGLNVEGFVSHTTRNCANFFGGSWCIHICNLVWRTRTLCTRRHLSGPIRRDLSPTQIVRVCGRYERISERLAATTPGSSPHPPDATDTWRPNMERPLVHFRREIRIVQVFLPHPPISI